MRVIDASPAQHRMWCLEQLDARCSSAQTLAVCIRFDGRVLLDRLRLALETVIDRHDVLRSVYRLEADRLVANVLHLHSVEILETGCRKAPTFDEQDIVRLARELAEAPFDLAHGPLLRPLIVANGSEQSYLVLVAHRIICDDWSARTLLRELVAAYNEGDAESPAVDRRSAGFVERTTRPDGGRRTQRDLAKWRQRQDGVAKRPPFAGVVPGSARAPVIYSASRELRRDVREEVAAYARARNVTPASVVAASLQALMYRLGLGEQSALGMRLSGRPDRSPHNQIGCFPDMIVLRGSVRGGDCLDQLVLRVRHDTESAVEHGVPSFEEMPRERSYGQDFVARPPYQRMLFIEDRPDPLPAIPGVQIEYISVPRFRGSIDTTFRVRLVDPDPAISVEWNGALTLPANRLIDVWLRLLTSGLRQPHLRMDQLPLTAESTGTATDSGWGAVSTVPELLRARAEREPRSIALVQDGVENSLDELVQRSRLVAERLRAAGVGTGTVVGLSATRSRQTIVATLGILEAGGVCVPLDPEYPPERLRFALQDSGASIVLTEEPRDCTWMGTPALMLDGTGVASVGSASRCLDADVAWVLYTSGSTGQPKGVLISHAMVVARLLREPIPWETDERCCHKTSLNFIDSIWEMFGPPAHGLPTVIADSDTARDPRALARLVERESVTRIVLVPSFLSTLLGLDSRDLSRLSGVRYWISSGEALPSSVAERFYRALPGATLVNIYGASECWDATWCRVPASVGAGDAVPIGGPLKDVSVWLLDEGLNPVPDELPGELFVGGPCVSDGYLERPEQVAGRFFPASLIDGTHAGMAFRTGDIACRRSNGSLEILGRRDLQIKLRGFRIEVEEVERQLALLADVVEAAVVPRRDDDGSVVALTAFLVLEAGTSLNVGRYRRILGEQLPRHCVPNDFVPLERLPLTANGKLDRAALLDRANAGAIGERTKRLPNGRDVEQTLTQIWCDVLNLEHIDANDDFFHLGGQSLLAVQVVLRIQDEFAAELSLPDFYADPTVSGLSRSLTSLIASSRCP